MNKSDYVELVRRLNWSLPKWKSNALQAIENRLDMQRGDPRAVEMFDDMYPGYERLISIAMRMADKGDQLEGIDAYNLINLCYREDSIWELISYGYQAIYNQKFPEPGMHILTVFMEGESCTKCFMT